MVLATEDMLALAQNDRPGEGHGDHQMFVYCLSERFKFFLPRELDQLSESSTFGDGGMFNWPRR